MLLLLLLLLLLGGTCAAGCGCGLLGCRVRCWGVASSCS
jgi:hypothetical protein